MKTATKKWTMPSWMEKYRTFLEQSGGYTCEEVMNCDGLNCNVVVNAPRAMMCAGLTTKIQFLTRLYQENHLIFNKTKLEETVDMLAAEAHVNKAKTPKEVAWANDLYREAKELLK
ncbi:hypothetical protein [Methylobacter sp.]|uniref:hypothetical protein n=1 Tax=Methylobacter sp. TaxID=2051955 RepID=UPI0011FFD832|nr:hypothetical protein [Methylobacter sp.]TAK59479.1 MAG: hypothetical protein EPO18_20160 [Methylobacter sp.]